MPVMHLKQSASLNKSVFTYRACGPFTKNKESKNPKIKRSTRFKIYLQK